LAEGIAFANEPNDLDDPINANLTGTMIPGTTTMATGKVHTLMIAKFILLCGFPDASIMVRYVDHQDLTEIEDVTMIGVDNVKDFYMVCDDGKFKTKPMLIHLRKFKAFLLYYMRRGRDFHTTVKEDDVLDMTTNEFKSYS
jgi:hypothetical protein